MTAQDTLPPPAKRIQYSRQLQQTVPDRVYLGDLHTSYLGTYNQRLRTGRCVGTRDYQPRVVARAGAQGSVCDHRLAHSGAGISRFDLRRTT